MIENYQRRYIRKILVILLKFKRSQQYFNAKNSDPFIFSSQFLSAQEADTVFYTFPDHQPDTIQNRLSRVNTIFLSDSIHLLIHNVGCFASLSYEYVIIKKKKAHAVYYTDSGGGKSRLFNLTEKNYRELRNLFECGIPLEPGGCTTSVLFEVSDKESSVYFIDSHCGEKRTYEHWLKRIFH